jgi:Glycosyl transferase family 2.
MGVVHAFERAISLADTDVLLLADQDDVWHRTKVEKYGALFEADDSVGAAFSDGEVVDENLRPLGYSLWECFQFTKRRRQLVSAGAAFAALLKKECVTGATLGFRRAHTRAVLPVPDGWMHDNWIALTAAAITTVAILPEQLIQYRQHKHNLEGAPRWSLWQNVKHACSNSKEVWPVVNKYQELARRLKSLEGVHESRLFEVDGKVRHLTRRATLSPYAMRRSVQIAHELIAGRYSRYSNGYRSAIVDLL